jgi:NADH-ubiquinone oxidoreductase chain 2
MLFNSLIYLLFSNSVTNRRDLSIVFNRIAILALLYSIILDIMNLYICGKGISLQGGLLYTTSITQIFQIFIFFISILILQLTSFYPTNTSLIHLCGINYQIPKNP